MAFSKDEIIDIYRRRSRSYDLTANLYYLIGFREYAYRRMAVDALNLKRGDTVVEVCCGTGLNFPLLQGMVGPEGTIIGVDLTDSMLKLAKRRVDINGWDNVILVQNDAAEYSFPAEVNGIISTFALTLVPEYDKVILNGCKALRPGGRWVVLDFKMPSGWAAKLAPLLILLTRPFGVTNDLESRHPWESIQKYMESFSLEEIYMKFVYIASGTRGETC